MSQGQRRRLISALASPCQLKALASAWKDIGSQTT